MPKKLTHNLLNLNAGWLNWLRRETSDPPPRVLDAHFLEERILYSATPLPVEVGGVEPVEAGISELEDALQSALDDATAAGTQAAESTLDDTAARRAIFLDAQLDGLSQLLDFYATDETTDVFLLDPRDDGVTAIAEQLAASQQTYASVHIVSHGSSG